jgi:hypothetical protein
MQSIAAIAVSVAAVLACGHLGSDGRGEDRRPPGNKLVTRTVAVAPGAITGRLLRQGTRTPLPGRPCTLHRAGGEVVATFATAADGSFALPELRAGSFALAVAPDLAIGLDVVAGAPIRSVDLVVPPLQTDPDPTLAAEPKPVGAWGLTGWAVAGLAGTAVAVPAAVAATTDDDESTISPTSSSRVRR